MGESGGGKGRGKLYVRPVERLIPARNAETVDICLELISYIFLIFTPFISPLFSPLFGYDEKTY